MQHGMFRHRGVAVSYDPLLMELRRFFIAQFRSNRAKRFGRAGRFGKSDCNGFGAKRTRGKQVNVTFGHEVSSTLTKFAPFRAGFVRVLCKSLADYNNEKDGLLTARRLRNADALWKLEWLLW